MNHRINSLGILSLAGLFLCAAIVMAAPKPDKEQSPLKVPDSVIIERDVEFSRVGDRPLLLDVVRPKKESVRPRPVVVHIHGGGWSGGDKTQALSGLMVAADKYDYIGFTIGYRLTGEASWPAQINDCKAGIRWIKSQAAKYHLDPDKIAVWGHSAGGHLVSLLGTTGDIGSFNGKDGIPDASARVTCVVDWAGPSDLLTYADKSKASDPKSGIARLLGGPLAEKLDLARAASPVNHVSSDSAPFLIMHGTKDPMVPITQAEELVAALEKVHVPVTFVRIDGGGHGIAGDEVKQRVYTFLDKYLRGQDVTVSSETIIAPAGAKGK